MKFLIYMVLFLSLFFSGACFWKDKYIKKKIETDLDSKKAYISGYNVGVTAKQIFSTKEEQKIFLIGARDSLKGKKALVNMSKQEKPIGSPGRENPKEGKQNKEQGMKFLEKNKKEPGVKTTASGLQYKVLKEGKGKSPLATDKVEVHYRGVLINGTEFDSSYKRKKTITFPLNRVIKGWTEGLQLMKEGAKYKFYIPPELGYGSAGTPGIPPHSVLIFEVELIKVQ